MGKNNKNTKRRNDTFFRKPIDAKPVLRWRLINKQPNFFDHALEENLKSLQKICLNDNENLSQKEDCLKEEITRVTKKRLKKRKGKRKKKKVNNKSACVPK